jgi:low temperature requirement protein LtrA
LAVFAAAAAMLVVALATPAAFGAEAVVFGIAYFLVRALHLVLFAIAARDDPELRRAVRRWAPGAFLGPSLLVGASFFDGSADLALWAAALAVDYLSPQVGHGRKWRLSPAHFVERQG